MKRLFATLGIFALASAAAAERPRVEFSRVTDDPGVTADAVFGLVEFRAEVAAPVARNPFREASFTAVVTDPGGKRVELGGFCDDDSGKVFRVRFMPGAAGGHAIHLGYRDASGVAEKGERFDVAAKRLPGPVRVDPEHSHHFVREGGDGHYFWNGTTAYWLLGVRDERRIASAIDRLAGRKVNRIRVALNARTHDGGRWFEPQVKDSSEFQFRIDPWPAANPGSVEKPAFDTSRFNLPTWRKLDRLVAHARGRGVVVSIVFHLDGLDPGVDPFNGGTKQGQGYADYREEEFYYRYAVSRLAAFANVMWDVTNEWHLFRDEKWVNHFGALIHRGDPFRHLISVHGKGEFPFYRSPWVDFAMYQSWDEYGGYGFLRKARERADRAGRPMPQVNEEYGYEDHYPGTWGGGRKKPARSGDNRRRLAWEMTMAGGYQTTGERADEPGMGGWITGLGNDRMTMLDGYAHLVEFFTAFPWWKCDPADGLSTNGVLVLAEPGIRYAVYAPRGGRTVLKLPAATWRLRRFDPRAGKWTDPERRNVGSDGLVLDFATAEDAAALIENPESR